MNLKAFIMDSSWRRGPSPLVFLSEFFHHLLVENLTIGLIGKINKYLVQHCLSIHGTSLKKISFRNQSCPSVRAYKQFIRKCPSHKRYFANLDEDYLLHVNQASQSMRPVPTSESSAGIYLVRGCLARRQLHVPEISLEATLKEKQPSEVHARPAQGTWEKVRKVSV